MRLISAIFLACAAASAQCIMCRTAAGAQPHGASDAMDKAIVILLAPAVAMFCGIFVAIFRHVPKNGQIPKDE